MNTRNLFRGSIALLLLGGVLSCQGIDPIMRPGASTGSADFTTYVAIGNSLTAGKADNALYRSAQAASYPALIAAAVGTPFVQPLIEEPGIWDDPTPFLPVGKLVIDPDSTEITIGAVLWPGGSQPANLNAAHPGPYNNLGIPGALTVDLLSANSAATSQSGAGIFNVVLRPGTGTVTPDSMTILEQALSQNPTFVTLWIGNNEILGAATMGSGLALVPPASYGGLLRAVVAQIKATGAGAAVANIPDVTAAPFFTTIPPVVVDPTTRQPILDPTGSPIPLIAVDAAPTFLLSPGDLVLLTAQDSLEAGMGIPDPVLIAKIMQDAGVDSATAAALLPTLFPKHGQLLPGTLTLVASEVASLAATTDAYNDSIAAICAGAGYPVVDIRGLLNSIAASGREIGGIEYTADFISGGVFSLDGVHATPVGYSLVAQAFVDRINSFYGASIADIDLVAPGVNASLVMTQGSVPVPVPLTFRFDPALDWRSVISTGRF